MIARLSVLIVLFAVLVAGCNSQSAAPASGDVKVESNHIVHPLRKSLVRSVEQPGSIQAYEETQLFARVPGYVSKIYADIGQSVTGPKYDAAGKVIEPGEILAEISVPELDEEVKQKRALVAQAEAENQQSTKALALAQANVALTQASVAEAQAGVARTQALVDRWDSEAKRVSALVKNGVLDVQTRDETLNQLRAAQAARGETAAHVATAEAALLESSAKRDKALSDVTVAEARVEVARAEAARWDATRAFAKIRAPFEGVVTHRHLNTGDFVQPSNLKVDSMFTVSRLDPVRIVIAVPEAEAGLVHDNSEVKLRIEALPNSAWKGTVARTSWTLDPTTRTLRAEIDMANKAGNLRPGMYVYARLSGQLPEGWVVPSTAVVKQGDTFACFLIDGIKASRLPVQVGFSDDQFIYITKKQPPGAAQVWQDISGNETIAAQAGKLTDGMTVQIVADTR